MNDISQVTKKILIINVCVFVVYNVLNIDLVSKFGMYNVTSQNFHVYQLITHLFVHANVGHLFSNMLTLLSFGPALEYKLSSKRFVIFYLITGVCASIFYLIVSYIMQYRTHAEYMHYFMNPDPKFFDNYLKQFPNLYNNYYGFIYDFLHDSNNIALIEKSKSIIAQLYTIKDVPIIGASGAVFGVLTAFAMLYKEARVSFLLLPIPFPAKYFVIFYGLYEFFSGINGSIFDNIAHFAHVGGIMVAYILVKLWYKDKNKNYIEID